jgi:hypothetical protein
MVDLKNVYRRSLVRPHNTKKPVARATRTRAAQSAGTPPSTFLFLPIHLSNSNGPQSPRPRRNPGKTAKRHHRPNQPGPTDEIPLLSVMGFPDADKAEPLKGTAPRRSGLYECASDQCQPGILAFFISASQKRQTVILRQRWSPVPVQQVDPQPLIFSTKHDWAMPFGRLAGTLTGWKVLCGATERQKDSEPFIGAAPRPVQCAGLPPSRSCRD